MANYKAMQQHKATM